MKGSFNQINGFSNQLVSRMLSGDKRAFSIIYRHFFNLLYRYGLIIFPDEKIVEDAIQNLFIWILENPEKMAKVKDFEIYLFQSLKKNLKNQLKSSQRRAEILRNYSHYQKQLFTQYSKEQQLIEEENKITDQQWLVQKLNELPAHQKEIIYLRFYEELNYNQIAEIISSSNQVIRNYVSRALKQLRKSIRPTILLSISLMIMQVFI